jgi:hypothetical protein
MDQIKQTSNLRKWFGSIPIVGSALGVFVEHTEMGIAQYGPFFGLLRGAVIGIIIGVALIAVSEVAVALFDVGRFWVSVQVTSRYKAAIGEEASRKAFQELNRPYHERHHDERPASAQAGTCPTQIPIEPCFWLKLPKNEKLGYILGAHDAGEGNPELRNALFPTDLSFGDTIEALDQFYADGAHYDIPVIDALREVRGR